MIAHALCRYGTGCVLIPFPYNGGFPSASTLLKKVSGSDSKASSPFLFCHLTATDDSLKSDATGTTPFLRLYGFYHNTFIREGKEGNEKMSGGVTLSCRNSASYKKGYCRKRADMI